MHKKHIYLDIDGVLNCSDTEEITPNGYLGTDPKLMRNLQSLCEMTQADVYITSTWRSIWPPENSSDPDHDYMHQVFEAFRIPVKGIVDHLGDRRGHGIAAHVALTKPITWVVLDDIVFTDFSACGILPHLVQTYGWMGGLTSEKAHEAAHILNTIPE